MTLKEKDIVAAKTNANSFPIDLDSALSRTSKMFELFISTLAIMKDRILARSKVGDLHDIVSESDVLSQDQVNSLGSSPLDATNLFSANFLLERCVSAPSRKGSKINSARASDCHHIGGHNPEEVRSKVVLPHIKKCSDCELIISSSTEEVDTEFSPSGVPSSGSRDGDSDFVSSGDKTSYRNSRTELGLKRADEHRPNDQVWSTPLDGMREWNVRANPAIIGSINPIRRITDSLVVNRENGKEAISLAMGDPAQFGPHMRVPEVVDSAVIDVVRDGKSNGYALSSGLLETRRAVADYLSSDLNHRYTPEDVTLTSGCSQAIQHSIDVLRFYGCNILVPRPGFPLYETLCSYFSVECRHFDLLQDKGWEVDLSQIADLADCKTAAIIICNPGNPCGSVFGYHHLSQIAVLAENLKVPIIADEVYSSLVFGQRPFIPMAKFSSRVPVFTVGGVSKNWLIPGWRLGWLAVADPHGILRQGRVQEALTKITQMTFGPCTLVQAALPQLLRSTPASFIERILDSLRSGAELCLSRIEKIEGLECPTTPQGSMFMMVKLELSVFHGLKNDVEFSSTLLKEESVLVLPGSAFRRPNWFRIVFALSLSELDEAWDRIEDFCNRHSLLR